MANATLLVAGAGAIAVALLLLLLAIVPRRDESQFVVRRKASTADTKSLVDVTSQKLVARADEFVKESFRPPVSDRSLELAGFPGSQGAAMVSVAAVAVFVALMVLIVTGQILLAILAGALVPVLAKVVVDTRAGAVRQDFADQLDEALQIIAAALRAGHGFSAAVASVAQNAAEPAASEFARIVNQHRIGRDLVDAMAQTADRMDNEDFRWVTEAVATHRETGGSLNLIIDRVATTIRERKELREEIRALASEGKYSGIVLMVVPVGIGAFFLFTNPTYMADLLFTTAGQLMLAGCCVLYVLGGVWIRKIVQVNY